MLQNPQLLRPLLSTQPSVYAEQKEPRMPLPNVELDASLLTVVCEFAHENGLSAQDCVNEALADWIAAVVVSRSQSQPLTLARKRPRSVDAPGKRGRIVPIAG